MELLVLVGGFHPEMPLEELRSLGAEVEEKDGRIVAGKTDEWEKLKRLGYSHLILKFLGSFSPGEELPFDPEKHIEGKFAGRFKKLDFSGNFDERRKEILGELDPHIKEVDLRNPDTTIYFFFRGNKIYAGKLFHEFKPEEFYQRKVAVRPFSRPISLPPREARCWVNLSGVEEGGKLLDPFCGTGGILIEAAMIDCKVYGSDLDAEMVSGSRMNLDYYGLEGEVEKVDAQELSRRWNESFDAVVTDPPYGRAAKVGGEEVKNLYGKSLEEISKVLKEGAKCVIGAPKKIGLEGVLKEKAPGLKTEKRFEEKVHGDLFREIYILRKV
ncbi:MAG: methyltransferase domain-containing protein [Candidatus Aenigmatarchaeota archaeon]